MQECSRPGARILFCALLAILLAVTPGMSQTFAYVAANPSYGPDNILHTAIFVIDTSTNAIVSRIPFQGYLQGMAITPDASRILVLRDNKDSRPPQCFECAFTTDIDFLDTSTNAVISTTTIPVPSPLYAPVIGPDGKRAYFSGGYNGGVTVFDLARNSYVTGIDLRGSSQRLAITGDGLLRLCEFTRARARSGLRIRSQHCIEFGTHTNSGWRESRWDRGDS